MPVDWKKKYGDTLLNLLAASSSDGTLPKASLSEEVASWGEFKMDELPLNVIAEQSTNAQKIINEIGW